MKTNTKIKFEEALKNAESYIEEMYRLIVNEETDNIYELSFEQKKAVEEAQQQFKNGQFLKSEQADQEIEEWLGK